jgi:predicted membrane protein (TIGR00267 family)
MVSNFYLIWYNLQMISRIYSASYLRNFIFGVEDSLVSTVGLLSGIAIANVPKSTILLTGVVLLFVEAVSMAAGSFLSESSADEYVAHKENIRKHTIISGVIMFFSYLLSGLIVLFPYIIFPLAEALKVSIFFSIISLFVLGIIGARISKINIIKNGFRMALVGGIAILVGALAGKWINHLS